MAITMGTLKGTFDKLKLRYVDLNPDVIGIGMKMEHTSLKVSVSLEENGEYLRLRTLGYATCAADAPGLDGVLEYLSKINLDYKLVKFGWDKNDGEICAEVAMPLEDNASFTEVQLGVVFAALAKRCDDTYKELERLINLRGGPRKRPKEVQTSAAGPPSAVTTKSPASTMLALGVMLIGLAAVAAVIYLFVK